MGRCGVLVALVTSLGAVAAADPLTPPCECGRELVLAPHDGAVVPRNAKLWIVGQNTSAFSIDGIDSSLLGEWEPSLGATVYTPTELRPGTYPFAYDHMARGRITVTDEIDHTPPARPELTSAVFEVDDAGEVGRLSLGAQLDRDTALVRITVATQIVITTPSHLVMCEPGLRATGHDRITVEAIDLAGNISPASAIEVETTRTHDRPCASHYHCGLGPTMIYLVGGFVLMIVVICTIVIAAFRRIHRGTTGEPPVLIPNLVATALAKHARARDGVVLLIVAGAVAAAWSYFGEWAAVGGIWVLIRLGDYIVANRALAILEHGLAIAELYGTNLVVRHDNKQSAVLLSRGEIRHARRAAVPTAKMT